MYRINLYTYKHFYSNNQVSIIGRNEEETRYKLYQLPIYYLQYYLKRKETLYG